MPNVKPSNKFNNKRNKQYISAYVLPESSTLVTKKTGLKQF